MKQKKTYVGQGGPGAPPAARPLALELVEGLLRRGGHVVPVPRHDLEQKGARREGRVPERVAALLVVPR